jgi:hypothetical protein
MLARGSRDQKRPRRAGPAGPAIAGAWLATALAGTLVAGAAAAETPPVRARLEPVHAAFLAAHCTRCHDGKEANGGVRLDDLPLEIGDVKAAARWAKVLAVLNSGEMPPKDEPRPADDAKRAFLEVLSKQIVVARKELADTGGAVTMRRLNRREYVNTIRELLDVEVNPGDLPADEDGGTFDTIGTALFFSSDQFEHYLRLGRAALDEAIVTAKRPARQTQRREPEEQANKELHDDLAKAREGLAKATEWRVSGRPTTDFGWVDETEARTMERVHRDAVIRIGNHLQDPTTLTGKYLQPLPWPDVNVIPHTLPPGRYLLRAKLGYPDEESAERHFIEYGVQGDRGWPAEMKLLGHREIQGTIEKPEIVELPITVPLRGHRTFGIRDRQHNTGDTAEIQRYWSRKKFRGNAPAMWRGLWIDWVEWEGPFIDRWPPDSHELALGGVDLEAGPGEEQARQVVARFAARAFRGRPVRPEYVDGLVARYAERRQAGEPFHEAIKTPLSIVLASPAFLYIVEPIAAPDQAAVAATDGPAAPRARLPLADVELANRLSYFLWAGPPDERLLSIAAAGQFRDRGKDRGLLAEEVDRMLADPRMMRFVSGFLHQWLHMVRLDFFQFNPRLYPRFDATGKAAARREVYETFRHVTEKDLPLGTLLKADFVVVNDVLADTYGIPGVTGGTFRRVPVPPGLPRGGLLGMAAILAMGSDGERSSPVERGAWVLRKLLNDPPPPAPANVPQLSRFAATLMPARELMTAHQEQPQCAQCHRRIDPIGYALQHFDAAGNWRDEEYVDTYTHYSIITKKATFPIDARGTLPDGTSFAGFAGLRDAVAAHEADFARGLVEHLLEYALGRPCGFSDEELVASILEKAKGKGYTPRAIIQAIVASEAFQTK